MFGAKPGRSGAGAPYIYSHSAGRTRKVQRRAARNGTIYHLGGAAAWLRDTVMRASGGASLLQQYDWLYDWRPPA